MPDCDLCADTGIRASHAGDPELCDHLPSLERVPNDVLREHAERQLARPDTSAADLAFRAGFVRQQREGGRQTGDTTAFLRALGMKPTPRGRGDKRTVSVRRTVDYDTAVRITFALGLDPHEVGV